MPIPRNLGYGDLSSPGTKLKLVTASDSTDLPDGICRAILIGTAGDARIIDADGNDSGATELVPLPAGILPVGFKRIYSTGLTAARIWAIY